MYHCIGTRKVKYTQRDTDKKIGENIAQIRKDLGIIQNDLAQELGVSRRALCSYECGKCSIPVFLLPKLSEVLKTPLVQLMDVKTPMLDERTRDAKILQELEKVKQLSKTEQKAVFTMIDSMAAAK